MYKVGDALAGCKLLQECGAGSFGSVFLAENLTTGQRVALKILYKHGKHYERELAGLTAYQEKCAHTNLMRIYHIDQNDECIFYTMDAADTLNGDGEYLPDTLANRLRQRKHLEASELRPMLDELLNGLEILHGMGLLHRDIKPDNILWVGGHAVLGDIGLVTPQVGASVVGTPGFIAPDVWNGKRDFEPRDDLYALAMTLYCALSGCSPRQYPDLPFSLTLGGGRDLIRLYNAVLAPDSKIRNVAEFRAASALQTRKPHRILSKTLWLSGFGVLLLLGGLVAWRISAGRAIVARQSELAGQNVSRTIPPQAEPLEIFSEKSNQQKIESLASALEREWREECQTRLSRARRLENVPIDLRQGVPDMTPQELRQSEIAKANERVFELQNQIDDEARHLGKFKDVATVAVQHFGDVMDDESPAMQKIKRKMDDFFGEFHNPEFLGRTYANFLLIRSRGGINKATGELEKFEACIHSLPQEERRLLCRSLVFQQLRGDYLRGGSNLLRDNFDLSGIGNHLAMVSKYLNTL